MQETINFNDEEKSFALEKYWQSAPENKTLLMGFWNWTIIVSTNICFALDTYHTSVTHSRTEIKEGRRKKDDMTLHNKKYHAKKQFIISFSQVFSISLSFKSVYIEWNIETIISYREKCFMLWNKSTASIFQRGSLSENQAWCSTIALEH